MFNSAWTYVGIGLLAWVGWDLYAGYTMAWEVIYRDENPTAYWITLAVWIGLGISCFFSLGNNDLPPTE